MNSIRSVINVLKINSNAKVINDSIFNDFSKLTKIEIMDGITAIGKSTFKNCRLLVEISIPASMQSIGNNAFENCTSLTEISIPASVNTIGDSAFEGCTSLAKVSIPTSVKSIGKSVFKNCPYAPPKLFAYSQGNELNGVIKYLTNKTGGNIHDNGTINISASSTWNPSSGYNVNTKNLCDFNDLSKQSMWSPKNEENSTLLFDFKTRSFKITDYTLHTPSDQSGNTPKSWVVECTNNMNNWVTVDTRNNESVMNKKNVCHTFKCQSNSDNFCRYIRFKSTDKDFSNKYYFFEISAVEFFGVLIESNS